jgi:hypothetical protein
MNLLITQCSYFENLTQSNVNFPLHQNSILFRDSNISIAIPIHIRYHMPTYDDTYTSIALNPPEIFFSCEICNYDKADLFQQALHANWTRICIQDEKKDLNTLNLEVPVGLLRHEGIVSSATLAVTLMGTFITVFNVLRNR